MVLLLPKLPEEGLVFIGDPPFFELELLEFERSSLDLGLGLDERLVFFVAGFCSLLLFPDS